ncbi:uncharacterized protein [Periplaneta americana]
MPPSLDKKLLEDALQTRVAHFDVQQASSQGENFMGNLLRVHVETEDAATYDIVIKLLPDMLLESASYLRENLVYSDTLPRMEALLRDVVPDLQPFSPRHVYSRPGVLIMADLSPLGFRMADRHSGLDLDHCRLVISTIARFHAASVALHEREPGSMDQYDKGVFSDPKSRESIMRFFSGMAHSLASEVETWPGFGEKYAHKLHRVADKMLDKLIAASERDNNKFNVLNHCDLWVNNVMFRYEGTAVAGVRLLDYQMVHFTSPAVDLQYFLNTSPQEDVRVNHTDLLLEEYHATLCGTLRALGCTQHDFSLEELSSEFDAKLAYGLFAVCVDLPILVFDGEFDLGEALATGRNPGRVMFSSPSYKTTMQRLLPIFDEHGLLD